MNKRKAKKRNNKVKNTRTKNNTIKSRVSKQNTNNSNIIKPKKKNFEIVKRVAKVALPIISIIAFILTIYYGQNSVSPNQLEKSLQRQNTTIEEYIDGIVRVDPSELAIDFNTGLDLYHRGKFQEAVHKFSEALDEQIKITGADSEETAQIYCFLGLSKLYTGLTDYSTEVISDLMTAKSIYENKDDTYGLATCYYYLANAYFEKGIELQNARESIEQCKECLRGYCPDGLSFLDGNTKDIESLYQICKHWALMRDIQNMLGKISFREELVEEAFVEFNYAVFASSLLYYADSEILEKSKSVDIKDKAIIHYLEQIQDYDELLCEPALVSYYETSEENIPEKNTLVIHVDFENSKLTYAHASKDTATILTNRAMGGIRLGKGYLAKKDCNAANIIWDSYKYSYEKTDKPYTDLNLALAMIWESSNQANPQDLPDNTKDEVLFYMNRAVSFELKVFGETPRLGYFYESLCLAYIAKYDYDAALECLAKAEELYNKFGQSENVKEVRSFMQTVKEALED